MYYVYVQFTAGRDFSLPLVTKKVFMLRFSELVCSSFNFNLFSLVMLVSSQFLFVCLWIYCVLYVWFLATRLNDNSYCKYN